MVDAGVADQVGVVLGLVRAMVAGAGADAEGFEAPVAVRVVEQCAEAERLLAALRVLAAKSLEDKAIWRREGFRSAAAWMAAKTGGPVGPAIGSLEMAGRLADLPLVAAAFLSGQLSEAQAREIADAASEVPDAEAELVEAARKLSLRGLQEECRRVEAAAIVDEDRRYRRVHRSRCVRSWVDRYGVARLSARLTADELGRLMAWTSAAASRSTTAKPMGAHASPPTTAPDSADGTTTKKLSWATPIVAVPGRGSGSRHPTGTRTSPPSAGSSPAPDAADAIRP